MKRFILAINFTLIIFTVLTAQKGVETGSKFGSGEDSIRCTRNLSLYDQDYRQKRLAESFEPWFQAFNECPLSTINLYSHGVKIVSYKYENESNADKKEEYYQLLMKVYDQRAKYFGTNSKYPTPYIMGIKALDMLNYKGSNLEIKEEAYNYLKANISTSPTTTQPAIAGAFFNTSISLYQANILTDVDVVNDYNLATSWVDNSITSEPKEEKVAELKILRNNLDVVFTSCGVANCETLEKIFSPIVDSKISDVNWLKNTIKILNKQNCEDSEVRFKVAETLYKLEPSADAAYSIARAYLKRKDLNGAKEYYTKAIELEVDPINKAKYFYQFGLILFSQGELVAAKNKATQAISQNGSYGDPYILLGKIFGASSKSFGSNDFEHKTVFWIAVDKFVKAKQIDPSVATEANELISSYSSYFPAQEELFFQGLKTGDNYFVGDWIGETTTIRVKK